MWSPADTTTKNGRCAVPKQAFYYVPRRSDCITCPRNRWEVEGETGRFLLSEAMRMRMMMILMMVTLCGQSFVFQIKFWEKTKDLFIHTLLGAEMKGFPFCSAVLGVNLSASQHLQLFRIYCGVLTYEHFTVFMHPDDVCDHNYVKFVHNCRQSSLLYVASC
jgi:hypothetical protein